MRKISCFIGIVLCFNFGVAKTQSITERQQLIDSIFLENTFLISEKLEYLTHKNIFSTSFNQLNFNILQAQINLPIPLKNIIHFSLSSKATNYELEAFTAIQNRQYQLAKINYKLAFLYSQSTKNEEQKIFLLKNIININYIQSDYKECSLYLNLLVLNLNKHPEKQKLLISCLLKQSKIALIKGDILTAENIIYKNTLPKSSGLVNKNLLIESFLTLSQIYLKTKSYTQSKWFAIQALDLAQKKRFRDKQITGLIALAKVKSITGDYTLAQQNLQSANLLCPKNSIYLADIYETQYQNNKRMGNLIQAQACLVKFLDFKKSLIN